MSEHPLVLTVTDRTARITLTRPAKRNSLSEPVLQALLEALDTVAAGPATGLVLAAEGPVFSAGHDFADVAARDVVGVRRLLDVCTAVMQRMHTMPQVVIARVQGLATAAGC